MYRSQKFVPQIQQRGRCRYAFCAMLPVFSPFFTPYSSDVSPYPSIKTLVQRGEFVEALRLYANNSKNPADTSKFIFPSLIKACAALSSSIYGKTVHSQIIVLGLQYDPYIISSLVNMYVKFGSLDSAVKAFDEMWESEESLKDSTVWNSIVDGYFKLGCVREGVGRFFQMQALGQRPDGYSLCILLGICGDRELSFKEGKQIHGYLLRNSLDDDSFLGTAVMDMYLRSSKIIDAWRVFLIVGDKENVVAWNMIIGGFCNNGLWESSLELYILAKGEKIKLVSTSFTTALSACCQGECVGFGRQLHCDIVKTGFEKNSYVCTSLITMYAKGNLVEEARKVFSETAVKGLELWNTIIAAYSWNNLGHNALKLYHQMRLHDISSDYFTLSSILSLCGILGFHCYGKSVHAEIIKRPIQSSPSVQSALLTMYFRFGIENDATLIFNEMEEKDTISWGSMISGFCQNKKFEEAMGCFRIMTFSKVKPDSDIVASVINACAALEVSDLGHQIQAYAVKSGLEIDVFVASTLIDMYSKSGHPEMAEKVFSGTPNGSLVAWNSMISCYSRNGLPDMSIRTFRQMLECNLCLDQVSITSVLTAVSSMSALLKGKSIHGYIIRLHLPFDTQVENSLIDMYMKCGILPYAENVFRGVSCKRVITWNLMISGYGSHGDCLGALRLFDEMRLSGSKPDEVTFLALLSSCNHAGFVEEGHKLFQCMTDEFRIKPKMDHYVNMIDLLGRTGRLEDAYDFLHTIPLVPDRSVWLSLLSASQVHCNLEFGEIAAQKLLEMDPSRGSNYVLLINLYVKAGLWQKAAVLRSMMKERGLKKNPGCSWIELRTEVNVFSSGDPPSSRAPEIVNTLNNLRNTLKETRLDNEESPSSSL